MRDSTYAGDTSLARYAERASPRRGSSGCSLAATGSVPTTVGTYQGASAGLRRPDRAATAASRASRRIRPSYDATCAIVSVSSATLYDVRNDASRPVVVFQSPSNGTLAYFGKNTLRYVVADVPMKKDPSSCPGVFARSEL